MINLILKDFLIQKKYILSGILYGLFVVIVFSRPIPVFNEYAYIAGTLGIAYTLILNANEKDEKNKSEIMLNSLPLGRRDIVCAKYCSVFVFALFGLLMVVSAGLLFRFTVPAFAPRMLNYTDLLASLFIVSVFAVLYFPLYFRFGSSAVRFFGMLFFMLIFFTPLILSDIFVANQAHPLVQWLLTIFNLPVLVQSFGLALLVLVFMWASFGLSLFFYRRREF